MPTTEFLPHSPVTRDIYFDYSNIPSSRYFRNIIQTAIHVFSGLSIQWCYRRHRVMSNGKLEEQIRRSVLSKARTSVRNKTDIKFQVLCFRDRPSAWHNVRQRTLYSSDKNVNMAADRPEVVKTLVRNNIEMKFQVRKYVSEVALLNRISFLSSS
jgi:hypothetical protein